MLNSPTDDANEAQPTPLRIMEAARSLFIQQGYHGTSMRQMAGRAGIALGGIYNHFAGKADIFGAVLERYHPWQAIPAAVSAAQGSSIEEVVRDAAERLQGHRHEHPDLIRLHLIELLEFHGRHLPSLFESIYARLTEAVQVVAARANQTEPMSAAVLCRASLGLFFTGFMIEGLAGIPGLPTPQAGTFDYFTDIYLQGLLAQERPDRAP